ncbi:glycoside hydrolase family 75 protein [Roseibacillus persicicus]|uniref:glycoside hydrolase family 75 protein n=1 Tax=Roseibacillus persicicus TaxID=454148 RepID=UPI00398B8D01
MKSTPPKSSLWKILCAILAVAVVVLGLRKPKTEIVEKTVEVPVVKEVVKVVEKTVEVEKPPVRPPVMGISRDADLTETSKGFTFRSQVKLENGGLATEERKQKSSYMADYVLTVRVPRAAATLEELEKGSPGLGSLFPGLVPLVEKASVSDFFEKLYSNKTDRLKSDAAKLGGLLTSHNFFDCQTMLNLTAENGRRVFLMQGDMDVVSDGSDGDRLPTMPDEIVNSSYYQPTTSYGWAKVGDTPNPLIKGYEKRLVVARKELADPNVAKERKDWVRSRIRTVLEPGLEEMKRRSFLIADYDPFIVIPMNIILDRRDKYGPKVGDYAVVVHEGIVYPAIVGDAGPTFKVGEASLRMARQINPKASPYWRPVSDLTVTYLCFPGTAKKPHRAPDYEDWRANCESLLGEIGGLREGVELFRWENTLPPLPGAEIESEEPEEEDPAEENP